jgi:hypothetical protein
VNAWLEQEGKAPSWIGNVSRAGGKGSLATSEPKQVSQAAGDSQEQTQMCTHLSSYGEVLTLIPHNGN